MGPGIPLVIMSLAIAIGVPTMSWVATGKVDRRDMSFFKRLWCVCAVLFFFGLVLIQTI